MPISPFVENVQKIEVKKTSLAPSSIVFFGGNYLGSKLVEKLLEKDSRVVVVDNFDSSKEAFYINLKNNPKLLMINVDIEKELPEELASADYVYFLNYQDYYNPSSKFKIVETTQFTKNILNFSLKSESKLVLVTNVDITNEFFRKTLDTQKLIEEIIGESEEFKKINYREVKIPILYGPRMSFENSGGLAKILDSYLNKDKVVLDDDNNNKNFFVYIDDAVEGIIRSIFSDKTQNQVINIVDSESFSELEIGSIIKSVSPRVIDVSYYENNAKLKWDIPEEKNLFLINFAPKTSLRNGIVKTLSYFGHETNTFSFKPEKVATDNKDNVIKNLKIKKAESTKETKDEVVEINNKTQGYTNIRYQKYKKTYTSNDWLPKSKKEYAMLFGTLVIAFVFTFVVLPSAVMFINLFSLKSSADSLETSFKSGDLDEASVKAENLSKEVDKAFNNFQRYKPVFGVLLGETNFNQFSNLILSAKSFSLGIVDFSKGVKPYVEFSKNMKAGGDLSAVEFNSSVNPLSLSLQNFIRAENLMEDVTISISEAKRYKELLPKVIKLNDILLATSRDSKDLLGFNEPKKILILFQNQAEIRPTGGFIGSYGVVEISKGKIINIKIDDIYNPDGQIDVKKVSVAPPEVIRFFLKENKLYIRNANFNSDFPTTAKTVNSLFEKATTEKFQTIIAIDSSFIEKFLETFGGIYLNTYQEEINSKNFTERAQFHSEVNYQEGVSEKKTFLTTLGSKVLEKFFTLKPEEVLPFADSFYSLLEAKNIQVYTELLFLSRSLNNLEWDGSLIQTKGDYLKIVNSNYGGNKVNYNTENTYKYEVKSMTRDGVLRGILTIDYKNNAKDKAWPNGVYVNYVKVLTQVGAKLTSAKIIDQTGKETNIFNSVLLGSEGPYQTFETSLNIEPLEKKKLVIEYDLAETLKIIKNKNTSYSLLWQKQSGEQSKASYEFTPLNGFLGENPKATKEISLSDNIYVSSFTLDSNFRFNISLK